MSRLSRVDVLSRHFIGGADCLADVSMLGRGGGEIGFDGADGGDELYTDEPVLDDASLPEGTEVIGGRDCWE